jgi:hypothetical protein
MEATFTAKTEISDEQVQRAESMSDYLNALAEETVAELVASMPEDVVGRYPFTRLYHDLHLKGNNPVLFGYPERRVGGWVHNRFRKQTMYPKEGTVSKNVSMEVQWTGTGEPAWPEGAEPQELEFNKEFIVEDRANQEELEKALTEVKSSKKRRIVKSNPKPLIDPTKVKKPMCSKHDTRMQFDAVENKWVCPMPDCKLVKRPKRDEDDKHVILGKGNVEFRMVQQGDKTTVVLISDDNVALDITKFVDLNKIISDYDIQLLAEEADKAGRFNFLIPTENEVGLSVKIVVMGAADIVRFK